MLGQRDLLRNAPRVGVTALVSALTALVLTSTVAIAAPEEEPSPESTTATTVAEEVPVETDPVEEPIATDPVEEETPATTESAPPDTETSPTSEAPPTTEEAVAPAAEELQVAPQVAATIEPEPVTCVVKIAVHPSSTGGHVRCLEARLAELGYSITAVADGRWDSSTSRAVATFQRSRGLIVDGYAGPYTLSKLGIWGGSPPALSCVVKIPVHSGSSGGHVRCLESRLRVLGYSLNGPNGTWDSSTTAAVRAYESAKGLPVDGKADPYTLTKLGIWAGPRASAPAASSAGSPCSVKIPVHPRSTGGHVRCLESKLKELGYSISGPNGTYDSKTVAAVKAFERSKGLPVDGKADPYTLTKLGIWAGPKVSFPCSVKISVYPTSTGGHVRCLESRLRSLGYSINSVYDGRVDQSTIGAIRRYQGSHALGVDGIAGPATMTKLGIWAGRPPAQILPANSGTGRRIVYSKSQMRLWTVEANGTVSKTHLVTGNRQWNNPLPGTYRVYSKSRRTCAVGNTNICWGYMVRFAYGPNGGRIGFHEIPTNLTTGTRLSTISQLGQSLSAGCVRQTTSDAIYIWNWAPVGTKVVVLN